MLPLYCIPRDTRIWVCKIPNGSLFSPSRLVYPSTSPFPMSILLICLWAVIVKLCTNNLSSITNILINCINSYGLPLWLHVCQYTSYYNPLIDEFVVEFCVCTKSYSQNFKYSRTSIIRTSLCHFHHESKLLTPSVCSIRVFDHDLCTSEWASLILTNSLIEQSFVLFR